MESRSSFRSAPTARFDPEPGALGYLYLFAGTDLTFAVSAIDSNGDVIEGDIIVST